MGITVKATDRVTAGTIRNSEVKNESKVNRKKSEYRPISLLKLEITALSLSS